MKGSLTFLQCYVHTCNGWKRGRFGGGLCSLAVFMHIRTYIHTCVDLLFCTWIESLFPCSFMVTYCMTVKGKGFSVGQTIGEFAIPNTFHLLCCEYNLFLWCTPSCQLHAVCWQPHQWPPAQSYFQLYWRKCHLRTDISVCVRWPV